MVIGFEKYTSELTQFEEEVIVPIIVKSWNRKDPTLEEKVTMKKMIKQTNAFCQERGLFKYKVSKSGTRVFEKTPYTITQPRMRKVIHHIRARGLVQGFIANSEGYYRTTNKSKIALFIQSCTQRANSFLETAHYMKHHNQI